MLLTNLAMEEGEEDRLTKAASISQWEEFSPPATFCIKTKHPVWHELTLAHLLERANTIGRTLPPSWETSSTLRALQASCMPHHLHMCPKRKNLHAFALWVVGRGGWVRPGMAGCSPLEPPSHCLPTACMPPPPCPSQHISLLWEKALISGRQGHLAVVLHFCTFLTLHAMPKRKTKTLTLAFSCAFFSLPFGTPGILCLCCTASISHSFMCMPLLPCCCDLHTHLSRLFFQEGEGHRKQAKHTPTLRRDLRSPVICGETVLTTHTHTHAHPLALNLLTPLGTDMNMH